MTDANYWNRVKAALVQCDQAIISNYKLIAKMFKAANEAKRALNIEEELLRYSLQRGIDQMLIKRGELVDKMLCRFVKLKREINKENKTKGN